MQRSPFPTALVGSLLGILALAFSVPGTALGQAPSANVDYANGGVPFNCTWGGQVNFVVHNPTSSNYIWGIWKDGGEFSSTPVGSPNAYSTPKPSVSSWAAGTIAAGATANAGWTFNSSTSSAPPGLSHYGDTCQISVVNRSSLSLRSYPITDPTHTYNTDQTAAVDASEEITSTLIATYPPPTVNMGTLPTKTVDLYVGGRPGFRPTLGDLGPQTGAGGPPPSCQIGATLGSVHLSWDLGNDLFGNALGSMFFDMDQLVASSIDSRNLRVPLGRYVTIAYADAPTNSRLAQVITPTQIIVVTDSSTTDQTFTLTTYNRPAGALPGTNGQVTVSGTPVSTVTVQNPDRTLATLTQLQSTTVTGSTTHVITYTYTASLKQWQMVSSDGRLIETRTVTSDNMTAAVTATPPPQRVEFRRVSDSSGRIILEETNTYQKFAFGAPLVKQVKDPSGLARTTTYTYGTTGTALGMITQIVGPAGDWSTYTYDSNGRCTKVVTPWQGSALGSADSLCHVIQHTYSPTGAPTWSRLESETILGVEVSRKFIIEYTAGYDEIVCLTQGAAYNATNNLTTKVRYYTSGLLYGAIQSRITPDGQGEFYSYTPDPATATIQENANTITTVKSVGQVNTGGTAIIDGTTTTTVTNRENYLIQSTTKDIVSNQVIDETIATSWDSLGRPLTRTYLDGTSDSCAYDCCQLSSETDRFGNVTTYSHDDSTGIYAKAKLGTTTKEKLLGPQTVTTRTGTDLIEVETYRSQKNLAGETTQIISPAKGTTTAAISYPSPAGRVETTTFADGGTSIRTYDRDGSLLSITGTAVSPVRYAYGVETTGLRWTKTIQLTAGGADTLEWSTVWTDLAGRLVKSQSANGGIATQSLNAAGQLVQNVDPDGVTTLYAYDGQGRKWRTAIDMNRNGIIDLSGTDQIVQADVSITTRPGGRVVRRTIQSIYSTASSGTPTVIQQVDAAVDGLDTWITTGTLVAQSHTSIPSPATGGWTVTATAPDGSTTVQTYVAGQLQSEVKSSISGSTTTVASSQAFTYDAVGRVSTSTDGRGAITSHTYDSGDRVTSITNPAPGTGGAALTMTYGYDSTGRPNLATDSLSGTTATTYWLTGKIKQVSGTRSYPINYTYTDQGRMATMVTSSGTTSWDYNSTDGTLADKRYAGTITDTFTYTLAGRPYQKTNGRSITSTRTYDNAGNVSGVAYSDATPGVSYVYDRAGRTASITSAGQTVTKQYTSLGMLSTETWTGGIQGGLALARTQDSLLRTSALTATLSGTTVHSSGFTYDGLSRLASAGTGTVSASYSYVPGASNVAGITYSQGGSTVAQTSKTWNLDGQLSAISHVNATSQVLAGHSYTYDALGRYLTDTREDSAQWNWAYDSRSEVSSASRLFPNGVPSPLEAYAFAYDDLGNRTTATTGSGTAAHTASYTTNALNQYTQRTVPGYSGVTGSASSKVSLLVNDTSPNRTPTTTTAQPETATWYWQQWSVNNSTSAQQDSVRVLAAKPGAGPGGTDLLDKEEGSVFVPQNPESFTYDADGNLTGDGRWLYTWDAVNRLISIEERSTVPQAAGHTRLLLQFTYDTFGRRIGKTVSRKALAPLTGWTQQSDMVFLYDGWNLIAQFDRAPITGSLTLNASMVWGSDLSGGAQGAGGAGGLLFLKEVAGSTPGTYIADYDGNGNVTALQDATTGLPVAAYDYGPFGTTLRATGPAAASNPIRFSTRYADVETGLLYYGYRYYSPGLGQWLSEDPSGEQGGPNLRSSVRNNSINSIDAYGLYAEPGHFYGTFLVGIANGMTPYAAFQFAYYSQLPDQVPALDALTLGKMGHGIASDDSLRFVESYLGDRDFDKWSGDVQSILHSLYGPRGQGRRCCLAKLLSDPTLPPWAKGFVNHALGDTFAHQDGMGRPYDYLTNGHLFDSLLGYDPDNISQRPERFAAYAGVLSMSLPTPLVSPGVLGQVQSWGIRASRVENYHIPPTPFYLFPKSWTDMYLQYEREFAQAETRPFMSSLPAELQNYHPDDSFNRLDSAFPLPSADQVQQLMDKIKKRCPEN